MVKVPRRKIIVGHANTFHDPAIVLIEGNQIFAEAIERHSQCKRAIEIPRLWYSWRAVHAALSNLGIKPISNADIVTVSSWDYDKVLNHSQKEKNANWKKGAITSPMLDMQVSCLWLEPIFDGQVDWIFRDIPPDLILVRRLHAKNGPISAIFRMFLGNQNQLVIIWRMRQRQFIRHPLTNALSWSLMVMVRNNQSVSIILKTIVLNG